MNKLSFPGAGHNGHTLIAAILDSHPKVSIANDYDAETGRQARTASYDPRQWDGDPYSYRLPGQGGIKLATILGTTGRALTFDVGTGYDFYIAIMRHPLDVIGSRYRRFQNRSETPEEDTFESFEESLMQMAAVPSHYMQYEHFVQDPEPGLIVLLATLGLTWEDDWLERAIDIVDSETILSRQYFPWTEGYLDRVEHYVNVDFRLKTYRGDIR
jgi:hypothetical protein